MQFFAFEIIKAKSNPTSKLGFPSDDEIKTCRENFR
jgi:hypothetical protein